MKNKTNIAKSLIIGTLATTTIATSTLFMTSCSSTENNEAPTNNAKVTDEQMQNMADNFSWDNFFDNTIQFYSNNPSEYLDPVRFAPEYDADNHNYLGGKIHLLKPIETYLREEAPFIFHEFQGVGDKYILTYRKFEDSPLKRKKVITEQDWKEYFPDVVVIMPRTFYTCSAKEIFIPDSVRILMDGWYDREEYRDVSITGCNSVAYYGSIQSGSRLRINISNCIRFMMHDAIPEYAILNYDIFNMPKTLRFFDCAIKDPILTPDMIEEEKLPDGTVKNHLVYPKSHKLAGQRVTSINIPESARVFMTYADYLIFYYEPPYLYDDSPKSNKSRELTNLTIDIDNIYIPPRTFAYFAHLLDGARLCRNKCSIDLKVRKISIGSGFTNYPYTEDGKYRPNEIGGFNSIQYMKDVTNNFINYINNNKPSDISSIANSDYLKLIGNITTLPNNEFVIEYRGEAPNNGGFGVIREAYRINYYAWSVFRKGAPDSFMSPILFPLKDSAYKSGRKIPPEPDFITPDMFDGQIVMSTTSKW